MPRLQHHNRRKLWPALAALTALALATFAPLGTLSAAPAAQTPTAGGLGEFGLFSAQVGWAQVDGRLWRTADGGGSWADITPPLASLDAVTFADEAHGYALSASGGAYTLARTDDAGAAWQTWPLPLFAPGDDAALAGAFHFQFINAGTGWLVVKRATGAAFSVGALFGTTDGGHTWARLSLPMGEPVRFVDSLHGWTAGLGGLFRTANGGLSWDAVSLGIDSGGDMRPPRYRLPRFDDALHGLAPVVQVSETETRVTFFATADGGDSWQVVSTQTVSAGADVPLALGSAQAGRAVLQPDVTEVQMVSPQTGWAKAARGACGAGGCTQTSWLLRTDDGGDSWTTLPLPGDAAATVEQASPASAVSAAGGRTAVFQGQGFDSCTLPTLTDMQTWFIAGPYRAWNLYIGGSSRAGCGTLTSAFINSLAAQGWQFIPTWVGPQAACSTIPGATKMSYNTATAFTQGATEADAALNVASNLGLPLPDKTGAVIYYDLEAYDTTDSACRDAARSFISGWSSRLRARGNTVGVYGAACSSAISDFALIANVPDQIWAAWWNYSSYNANASVWNLVCLDNTLWVGSQRLHQYAGGHNETWGGATINIDSNVLDGVVASLGLCYSLTTDVTPPLAGSVIADPAPNCGGTGYADGTVVQLTAAPGQGYSFVGWGGDLSGLTSPVSVTVSSNLSVIATFAQDTGWLSPTADAAQTTQAGDNNGYEQSPANAYASDGLFAVDMNSGVAGAAQCSSARRDRHQFYGFDVNLPPGSTLTGLAVRLDAKADNAARAPKICVQLSADGGKTWTAAESTPNLSAAVAAYALGGAGDGWGRAWVANDVTAPNLQVRLTDLAAVAMRDFYLDWVAVKVYFQP